MSESYDYESQTRRYNAWVRDTPTFSVVPYNRPTRPYGVQDMWADDRARFNEMMRVVAEGLTQ